MKLMLTQPPTELELELGLSLATRMNMFSSKCDYHAYTEENISEHHRAEHEGVK